MNTRIIGAADFKAKCLALLDEIDRQRLRISTGHLLHRNRPRNCPRRVNSLRDASDRTIVATARVHRLRLVTSGLRIVESDLVPVVQQFVTVVLPQEIVGTYFVIH